jgi:hypothetical protein
VTVDRGPGATQDPARRRLCLCLRSRWDPAALQAVRDLGSEGAASWEGVAALAREEFLLPLLYDALRGKGLVPAPVEEAWRQVYYDSIVRSTRLFHQLGQVLQGLAQAGCPVLLLKGAALAEAVYGHAALRPMVDLDLLVAAPRIGLAEDVLAQLGYTALIPDPWPGFSQRYRNSMAYGRESGYPLPWMVGLHWHLYDVPYYQRIPIEEWFTRGEAARVAGVEALLPSPEDHLIYLCGHLALHHQYDPALMRYYDMAAVLHSAGERLDWDTVLQRAGDWRLVIAVQRTLTRLEELWPGTVPGEAGRAIRRLQPTRAERAVHHWVAERPRTPTLNTLLSVATLPGLERKARFVLEAAFPSPAYMRQRYCPGHPGRWPLAYLLRLGWAARYLVQRLR